MTSPRHPSTTIHHPPTTILVVGAVLSACCLLPSAYGFQGIFRKAPPGVEEALRARVTGFYTLFQQNKFRQTEAFVAEESRDTYYKLSKSLIRGFEIQNIDFEPDFRSAKVLVTLHITPPIAGGLIVPTPVTGDWGLIDGQWFLVLPERKVSPFGPMNFGDSSGGAGPSQPPTVQSVTEAGFRVDPQRLLFPREPKEPITQTVVIKNNLPGALMLQMAPSPSPSLTLALSSNLIPPKGEVTLQVTYDPRAEKLTGSREIKIEVQPVNRVTAITVLFE